MRKRVGVMALAAAGALAFGGTYARAANIGVTPTKLIVVDKLTASGTAKAVFVAKDSAIDKGSATDPTLISAFLNMQYDNGVDAPVSGDFQAPSGANWLVNKTTVAKYVNKLAPSGGGTKVSVIKPGNLVKLVGKNLGDTPLNILSQSSAGTGTAHTAYCVTNDTTSNCFCSELNTCVWKSIAGGTGAKLVCKGGVADSACTAAGPPPAVEFLSFVTAAAGGTCGAVKQGGSGGTTVKALACGGLNIGGGASTVAEGPTPGGAETQFKITGGPTSWTVSAATAVDTGSNNNCSDTGCQFGPYLAISNAGTSTCVRNTFSSPASGTTDTSTGSFNGSVPLSSEVFLTANATAPCPRCVGGTPGVTNSGTCQAGWTSGVGSSPTEGNSCTPTDTAGSTYDCVPPAAASLGAISVNLNPLTTATATDSDPSGNFCPGQANPGAFGCLGSGAANPICPGGNSGGAPDYIEEVGTPAGTVTTTPSSVTLASVFCIPSVGGSLGFLINGAANLPGPGATSLPGTIAMLP
ncbi:MAG TPA: hypothetical protein VNO26_05845 [Candidatus Limnocylindria bacterium]|nr:hypothetical protein [Candidatus Limnocylindria bacterium]